MHKKKGLEDKKQKCIKREWKRKVYKSRAKEIWSKKKEL